MKPRVVGLIKQDENDDLEKLLPLSCDGSPAYVSYTTARQSNCGSSFLRAMSAILFIMTIGMAAGWFIHCAVFMNTTSHRVTLDARLLFHFNDTDFRVQAIEEKLAPSLLGQVWNNGSIDIDLLREIISVLIGKDVNEVVIPPDVMGSMMRHMSEIMNSDFRFFMTDVSLQKSLFAMFTQKPMTNETVSKMLLSVLAGLSTNSNFSVTSLLTQFPNITALSQMISDTTDSLQKLALGIQESSVAPSETATTTTTTPETHENTSHHHHHHNGTDHDR